MVKKNKLVILIPARSGSKRVKNKNLKVLGGQPLLGHKIKSCIKAKLGEVIVSTDSKKIASFAKKKGAKIPFLRPKKYSTSKASTMSCALHYLRYLKTNKLDLPEYLSILPATNPFLTTNSIKRAFKKISKFKKFHSIISYTDATEHPFLIIKNKKKIIFDIIKYDQLTYSKLERTQDWPNAIISSSALKISKTKYLTKYLRNLSPLIQKKIFDMSSCIGYKINKFEAFDINSNQDFIIAESIFKSLRLKKGIKD